MFFWRRVSFLFDHVFVRRSPLPPSSSPLPSLFPPSSPTTPPLSHRLPSLRPSSSTHRERAMSVHCFALWLTAGHASVLSVREGSAKKQREESITPTRTFFLFSWRAALRRFVARTRTIPPSALHLHTQRETERGLFHVFARWLTMQKC